MESLILHIEYLLQRHDCVILPGLGAFIATRQSARYVKEQRCFMPPTRDVYFNAAIKTDDGLLVDSIRRKLRISFDEARAVMSRNIEDIIYSLNRQGEVAIGKIGTLSTNSEGCISFQPAANGLKAAAMMGRTVVTLAATDDAPQDSATAHSQSKQQPLLNPNYFYLRIHKQVVKVAASFLLVMIVALSLLIPTGPSDTAPVEASVVPVKEIIKNTSARHLTPVVQEVPVADTSIEETERHDEEEPAYGLIVATFRSQKRADSYINSCPGDKNLRVLHNGNRWMVAAAVADNREELQEIARTKDFTTTYPQSWIWAR